MFVRTMRPQPPMAFFGNEGYAACTSGRVPSMNRPLPTNNCAAPTQFPFAGAASPATAARHRNTFATSTSSSAHPVNGTAPVTPVALLLGVSTTPKGFAEVPGAMTASVTLIGPVVLPAPANVSVTAPV